jgi:hypothetical protein
MRKDNKKDDIKALNNCNFSFIVNIATKLSCVKEELK